MASIWTNYNHSEFITFTSDGVICDLWGLKKHIKMPTFPLSLYFGFHSPVVSGAQGELRRSQRFPVVNKNYDKLPISLLCNVSTHKFSLRFEFFATALHHFNYLTPPILWLDSSILYINFQNIWITLESTKTHILFAPVKLLSANW